jgi:non-specific serine/threonine protein kinase
VCTESPDVLAILGRLADKSLIVVHEQPAHARHRLLDTIRYYAAERLVRAGEAEAARLRHARYFAECAAHAADGLIGASPGEWQTRLVQDHDNLRAALVWLAHHEPTEALAMAASLWWFWFRAGLWIEGRQLLERVLASADGPPTPARARGLLGLGVLAWAQGDHRLAGAVLSESVALSRRLRTPDLGLALQFLAMETLSQGDLLRARQLVDESVLLLRQGDSSVGLAVALASQGVVGLAERDIDAARAPLEESVLLLRAVHDDWGLALPLRNLGIVALLSGELERADALLRESLAVLEDQRDPWFVSRSLETLAAITAARGDHRRAARLFGAGEALRARIGAAVLPFYRADYDRAVAATRAALGDSACTQAWAAGRAMHLEAALAFALEPGAQPPDPLSPREREVLGLVAQGLSNRSIAEALVITEKTAEAHVGSILRKLNITSRAQAAVWAVQHRP